MLHVQGVDAKSVETDVTMGEILGTPLGSLQKVLQDVFQPWTEHNEDLKQCSDGDWKEYRTKMSKFTDLVTEAVGSLEMGIELKMPDERYSNIAATPAAMAKAAVDRCFVSQPLSLTGVRTCSLSSSQPAQDFHSSACGVFCVFTRAHTVLTIFLPVSSRAVMLPLQRHCDPF